MAGIIKSVVEKSGAKGTFWIAVIDGEGEVMAFDKEILGLEGKPCPYEIGVSGTGKKYVKFPKAGGFQKSGGGFQRGKSDKEIYAQIFTMSMAYAKDLVVAFMQNGGAAISYEDATIRTYRAFSNLILADLAKVVQDIPKPSEPPKTESRATESVPQQRSNPEPPPTGGTLTVKEKLKQEMHKYLKSINADTDNAFKSLLIELTEFPGKDRETKELTGKMVYIDDFNNEKFTDKWAQTAYGKLKKLIEEEELKQYKSNTDDDIPF